MGPIPQITSVVIPEQHFLSSGIGSQNQKLLSLGSDGKARDQKQIYRLKETKSHWGLNPPPSQMRHPQHRTFMVNFFLNQKI